MTERVTDISTFREYKQYINRLDKKADGDASKISLFMEKPTVNERFKNFFNVADGNLPYEP